MNSTWLITSELAHQRAQEALFTCVVSTNLLKTGSLDNAVQDFIGLAIIYEPIYHNLQIW